MVGVAGFRGWEIEGVGLGVEFWCFVIYFCVIVGSVLCLVLSWYDFDSRYFGMAVF